MRFLLTACLTVAATTCAFVAADPSPTIYPLLAFVSPRTGDRVLNGTIAVRYEVNASQGLMEQLQLAVCITVDDSPENFFCFPERARALSADGLAVGAHRLHARLRCGLLDKDLTPAASVAFDVVARTVFLPTYEWQRVEPWQDVPPGLEVRMPVGDGGNTGGGGSSAGGVLARISDPFQLQHWLGDVFGFLRTSVRPSTTLAELGARVAEATDVRDAACIAFDLGEVGTVVAGDPRAATMTARSVGLFGLTLDKRFAVRIDTTSERCACQGRTPCDAARQRAIACTGRHPTLTRDPNRDPWEQRVSVCTPERRAFAGCLKRCNARNHQLGNPVQAPAATAGPVWSAVQCGAAVATPFHAAWCRCERCSFVGRPLPTDAGDNDGPTLVVDIHTAGIAAGASSTEQPLFPMSQSRHWAYFDSDERVFGRRVPQAYGGSACARVVERPTFVFSVFQMQNVYHLVQDLLLPLHSRMIAAYGGVPRNALLVVHVGQNQQAPRLRAILDTIRAGAVAGAATGTAAGMAEASETADGTFDKPFHMLNLLSNGGEIWTKGELESLPGRTCFSDLHVGLDLSATPVTFSAAYAMERLRAEGLAVRDGRVGHLVPAGYQDASEHAQRERGYAAVRSDILDRETALGQRIGAAHERLNRFLVANVLAGRPPAGGRKPGARNVLFIRRTHSRRFANLAELRRAAEQFAAAGAPGGWVRDVALERIPFAQQVELFQNTSVLVTTHGQGAANVAFVPPGGAMVLAMPPRYRGWSNMYVNIAVASGVHAFVYRRPGETNPTEGLDGDWLGHGDFSSSHPLRDVDVTIDPTAFASLLNTLDAAIATGGGTGGARMHTAGTSAPGPSFDQVSP